MRRTLGVACACVLFQFMFIFDHAFVSYRLVLFAIQVFHAFFTVKSAENKMRKGKSTLLQGAGIYIAKNKTRLENKYEKVNKAIKA